MNYELQKVLLKTSWTNSSQMVLVERLLPSTGEKKPFHLQK